jgi:N6-adenosine-specific RNA methylase IME4
VIVILEWNQRDFYSYNISVTPQLEYILADNARIQMNISYNTFYNVNIVALPPCGRNSSPDFIVLHYGKCHAYRRMHGFNENGNIS